MELHGTKIPLYELRQTLLIQQEKYMKLMTDNDIKKLSRGITKKNVRCTSQNQDSTTEELRLQLASLQCTLDLDPWLCGMITQQSYSRDTFSLLFGLFKIQQCFTVNRNAKANT